MPPKKGALGSALFSDVESLGEKKEKQPEVEEVKKEPPEQVTEPLKQEVVQEGVNRWGKRGKSDYSQICGQIPKELHLQFKSKVALTGRDMATVLEELIANYVERND